ncbi:DUF817 domain-containing protein [Salibacterium salarium]|uniref:DUF817 domain-containing protein n=2 Tax=Salibacterium salarium TaxID=284579 RepID=A0A3R9PNX0_9BACI|nr:DUF817 domain-containing protein [Salibacterium salarium]
MSCIFPVAIFATLAVSNVIDIPFLYRYDFILLICLIVQLLMFRTGMETVDELKVIGVFHIIGLTLELYKVHMGSWAYPEEAWTKVFGVPLYSGFMYASVASYMCQAWRRLHLNLREWPVFLITVPLGAMIYLNFFTHHFIFDIRWILMIILVVVFIRTYVEFQVDDLKLKMPLVLSFFLIGFFVWIAENISTLFGAWQYPNQGEAWEIVHIGKISSWFLLVIVSFIIVAQLKHIKERKV